MLLQRRLDVLKNSLLRILFSRRCTLTKALFLIFVLSFLSFLYLNYHYSDHVTIKQVQRAPPPVPAIRCHYDRFRGSRKLYEPHNHNALGNLHIGKRVLLLVESPYTKHAKKIANALSAARFEYKVEYTEKSLPTLTHMDKGRFGVIIFDNFQSYVNMDYWNRQLLDKYCKEYRVGVIFFVKSPDDYGVGAEKIPDFHLLFQYNLALKNYKLNEFSDVWRISRPGEVIEERLDQDDWTVFHTNHSTYQPLAFANAADPFYEDSDISYVVDNRTLFPAVLDLGLYDGIKRIFFGNSLSFWLHQLMLLDGISYLSHGKLALSLERYIQIDIDDIFVGATGTRMKVEDVEALVQSQQRLQQRVKGFHFMLGFSGGYYKHGNDEEDAGDQKILEYRDHFYWFPHMWRHQQAHKLSEADLKSNMQKNFQFAKDNNIPVLHQYAVAPHHSGVYPVHEELYNTWKSVWDVRVTSTEEYPKLHPFWIRKGFIHKGIMVLPRQTCGLYTHTLFMDSYPGGRSRLDSSIKGGDIFISFLYNIVNIFMTHLANYGSDRLALYTFESVIKFVQCWTNLQLLQVTPLEMAMKYFDVFQEETTPIWKNPCDYHRHLEIWSANKTCDRLPKFLVIGPQKTGTTALYTFLLMHPAVESNYDTPDAYEEMQFFSGNNYHRGIDWYMDYFPKPANSSFTMLFEKSAGYFDHSYVPQRAHALLPNAKLICLLINPAKRAYSWYQHIRSHQDPVALNHSFYDIITAPDTSEKKIRDLRNRCLTPGLYYQHLMDWLDYYSSSQIMLINGDRLKTSPIKVMDEVQDFLRIEPHLNYSQLLRFDPKKGFYCQVISNNQSKCLGGSKGRRYAPMDPASEEYLRQFYSKHNSALHKLLTKMNYPVPAWLDEELKAY